MSYMVARMQKMKAGNLGGAHKHNERIFNNHSNKDIDTSRSHLNYELTDRDRSVSYEKQIKGYIEENKTSHRATRADAVLCDEWIITSDSRFFERLDEQETRRFFETAMDFFEERYGEENIAYASVHLDESTPHMHMGIVPMRDGKLSSKAMFTREELKAIQNELPRHMQWHDFELERGQLGSDKKHKTVDEFKQEAGNRELGFELVDKFKAPSHVDTVTGEFAKYWEYVEQQETIEELQGLFSDYEISPRIRETTLEERVNWVKNQVQELEGSKTALKARLSDLSTEVREKTREVAKIDSRASESLSELSKAEGYIEVLEKRSRGLEAEIGRLESENLRLSKQNAGLREWQAMSESELEAIKPKKNLLGKEYVELTKEQFYELRGLVYQNKNLAHERSIELEHVKRQIPVKHAKNGFERRLEQAREKARGTDKESLERENGLLRGQLSIATQQNQKMAQKLKELMPRPAFEKLMQDLQAIKPIVGAIKKVLEKGLGLER